MRVRFVLGLAVVVAAAALPAAGYAQWITGEAAAELRWFPKAPLFPDQRDTRLSPSFTIEPEVEFDWSDGELLFTFSPFARVDAHDDRRTHVDIRELSLTWLGSSWTAMAGLGRVFWGVTEVNHLVDIINQTDGVEDIDNEDKLGQPMVNVTVQGTWGALDLFWLPYFRERTFPDRRGRLRGPFPVVREAAYESRSEAWHQDVAARWSQVVGALDLGVSFFRGTSREPELIPADPGVDPSSPDFALRPHYSIIDQTALEIQWTGGAALWKLEGMTRGVPGERFVSVAAGLEYTLYQAFAGASDLGLLAEVMIDGRGPGAPRTVFDNDVFAGVRWALNDAADTSVLGGVVVDYEVGEAFAIVEAQRRVRDAWTVELEARSLYNTDPGSLADVLRQDSFFTLRVSRFW